MKNLGGYQIKIFIHLEIIGEENIQNKNKKKIFICFFLI